MALFKIFKGNSKNLGIAGGTNKTREGYAYFTPDDGKFYIDIKDSDTPFIGNSTADIGVHGEVPNRICINASIGSGAGDFEILDCGTASGEEIIIRFFNCGDSSSVISEDTIRIVCGDSFQLAPTETTIVYECGTSFYNV